jgi:hypothetical protein
MVLDGWKSGSNPNERKVADSDFYRKGPETAFGEISKRRGWQHRHGPARDLGPVDIQAAGAQEVIYKIRVSRPRRSTSKE